jgi:hypothetical protein
MDFIEALPKVGGKSVILIVVDRFSKYAHFILLAHPYMAESVAKAFSDNIVRVFMVFQHPSFRTGMWCSLPDFGRPCL